MPVLGASMNASISCWNEAAMYMVASTKRIVLVITRALAVNTSTPRLQQKQNKTRRRTIALESVQTA